MVKKVIGTSTTFFLVLSIVIGLSGATLTPHILRRHGHACGRAQDAIAYLAGDLRGHAVHVLLRLRDDGAARGRRQPHALLFLTDDGGDGHHA
jgi:hypothetical protein